MRGAWWWGEEGGHAWRMGMGLIPQPALWPCVRTSPCGRSGCAEKWPRSSWPRPTHEIESCVGCPRDLIDLIDRIAYIKIGMQARGTGSQAGRPCPSTAPCTRRTRAYTRTSGETSTCTCEANLGVALAPQSGKPTPPPPPPPPPSPVCVGFSLSLCLSLSPSPSLSRARACPRPRSPCPPLPPPPLLLPHRVYCCGLLFWCRLFNANSGHSTYRTCTRWHGASRMGIYPTLRRGVTIATTQKKSFYINYPSHGRLPCEPRSGGSALAVTRGPCCVVTACSRNILRDVFRQLPGRRSLRRPCLVTRRADLVQTVREQ